MLCAIKSRLRHGFYTLCVILGLFSSQVKDSGISDRWGWEHTSSWHITEHSAWHQKDTVALFGATGNKMDEHDGYASRLSGIQGVILVRIIRIVCSWTNILLISSLERQAQYHPAEAIRKVKSTNICGDAVGTIRCCASVRFGMICTIFCLHCWRLMAGQWTLLIMWF